MTTVHRLLDDAFAGVELTPEVQDLKEEIRANLAARAAELETSGAAPDAAARRAFDELGDVRSLVADAQDDVAAQTGGLPRTAVQEALVRAQMQRVRPRPGFVVSIVVAALVFVGLLVLAVLDALGVLALPAVVVALPLLLTASSAAGFIVGHSLAQETTTNHPMPSNRAGGYYLASGLAVYALLLALFTLFGDFEAWIYVVAGAVVVVAAAVFVALGVTQTNRKKAWVREAAREHGAVGDRFERDPEAAARFGIFTAVIWVTAFVVFVVLGFTVGWAWALLALVGGWIVFMLVLARMLFAPAKD